MVPETSTKDLVQKLLTPIVFIWDSDLLHLDMITKATMILEHW